METIPTKVYLKRGSRVKTIDGHIGTVIGGDGRYVDVNIGQNEYYKVVKYLLSEVNRLDLV